MSAARLRLLMAALCTLLGATLWLEIETWTSGPLLPRPILAGQVAQKPQEAEPGLALAPEGAFSEITARPLFSASRRPPRVAARAPSAPADLLLIGVVTSADDRSALISHGRPAKIERVAPGQELDGWTVQDVLLDRVVLVHQSDSVELKAKDGPPPRGAPPTAGANPTGVVAAPGQPPPAAGANPTSVVPAPGQPPPAAGAGPVGRVAAPGQSPPPPAPAVPSTSAAPRGNRR